MGSPSQASVVWSVVPPTPSFIRRKAPIVSLPGARRCGEGHGPGPDQPKVESAEFGAPVGRACPNALAPSEDRSTAGHSAESGDRAPRLLRWGPAGSVERPQSLGIGGD